MKGRELIEYQKRVGPLPARAEEIAEFIARAGDQAGMLELAVELSRDADEDARRLERAGIEANAKETRLELRFPADAHALAHCLELAGCGDLLSADWPAIMLAAADGMADPEPHGFRRLPLASLAPRRDLGFASLSHRFSPAAAILDYALPVGVTGARAAGMGYSPVPMLLTVMITNVAFDRGRGMLVPTERGPVVALCAEHQRLLESLAPPMLSPIDLERARRGVKPVRMPRAGFLGRGHGLRVSAPPPEATQHPHAAASRDRALAWISELDRAWKGRLGSLTLVGWTVYASREGDGLLDAAEGNPLPAAFFTQRSKETTR